MPTSVGAHAQEADFSAGLWTSQHPAFQGIMGRAGRKTGRGLTRPGRLAALL